MKYTLLNFAYGYGPFLRTTELALAVNDELEKNGKPRCGIIVPLVYGDRQKNIMRDEFGPALKKNPDEILFDETLGSLMSAIFYGTLPYEASLLYYLDNQDRVESRIQKYFEKNLEAHTFDGISQSIRSDDIVCEINRAPRVSFGITPSYAASFAYVSEILERAIDELSSMFDTTILKRIIPRYEKIEKDQTLRFLAEPSTFTYLQSRQKYSDTILTPPNLRIPQHTTDPTSMAGSRKPLDSSTTNQRDNTFARGGSASGGQLTTQKGIFVTVTGIPGLENLFQEARDIGLTLYTNKPEAVSGSVRASPHIINRDEILLHFARSGWGSIWLSQFTKTPFVAPEYAWQDDPEIYFNNQCIEKLGIGTVYHGQPLKELLSFTDEFNKNVEQINAGLLKKYGTLDGVKYTAKKITEHLLAT